MKKTFDGMFGSDIVNENDKRKDPIYSELKIPKELNKSRQEIFDMLGLDIIKKYENYDKGIFVKDKKGDQKFFVVSRKTRLELAETEYDTAYESIPEKMDRQKYLDYVRAVRSFLVKKYDEENIPVGQNSTNIENIKRNLKNFDNLDPFDHAVFYEDDGKKILKGYNNSGNSVNHWFPEMVSVRLTKGKGEHYSIFDQIRIEKLFFSKFKRIVVDNKLKIFDNYNLGGQKVFDGLGAGLRVVSGAQPVTNIRCPVAKFVWQWSIEQLHKYPAWNEFICWDPSMGWAGRLIGFLAASKHMELKNKRAVYIGTDPNEQIFDRYKSIEAFWKQYINTKNCIAEVKPLCIGSEEFHHSDEFKEFKGRGSVVYTSPPYFAKERYSDDPGQSYMKFAAYEDWKEGFLKQTIQNAYDFLMPGGLFFWNIADVYIGSKKMPLENDSKVLAKEIGFEYQEVLHQLMKTFPGRDLTGKMIEKQIASGSNFVKIKNPRAWQGGKQMYEEKIWQKFEPIYIFKKPLITNFC